MSISNDGVPSNHNSLQLQSIVEYTPESGTELVVDNNREIGAMVVYAQTATEIRSDGNAGAIEFHRFRENGRALLRRPV
jgi:hypothetical protein